MKTVCIEARDDGQFAVGIKPEGAPEQAAATPAPGADMGAGGGGAPQNSDMSQGAGYEMQPAATIDEAFEMARAMLVGGQDAAGQEAQADKDMAQGFNKARSPIGAMPGERPL